MLYLKPKWQIIKILPESRWIMRILKEIKNKLKWNEIFIFGQYIIHTFPTAIILLVFGQNYAGCKKKKNYCCFGECHDSTVESIVSPLPFKLKKCMSGGRWLLWHYEWSIQICRQKRFQQWMQQWIWQTATKVQHKMIPFHLDFYFLNVFFLDWPQSQPQIFFRPIRNQYSKCNYWAKNMWLWP